MSSKPTTLTSPGTETPRSWKARSRPSAIWSLAANTAVQSGSSASASPAAYPDAAVQSPCSGSGTGHSASSSTARHACVRRCPAKEASGPVRCHTVRWPRSSRCRTALRAPSARSVSTTL